MTPLFAYHVLRKIDNLAAALRSIAAADFPHKSGSDAVKALRTVVDTPSANYFLM